ncbi:DMT family transporter [Nonomuraea africana]|uniref:Quaternary ammonium compound-resistance protein SugE n=1 Tax=Nonomuraea africana TaxID=46171 RepID=A0ABR9KM53_9ACTN|nr:multidrug efflux SMR transporter [Nonomuraea africana]MBE1563099.1 quaternary ammonium compound-resistance protein SugE [Nonomuraea africana]
MAWVLLVLAAGLEIVWATALERSDGFSRPWPALLGVAAAALSLVLLTFALRSLPMGTAYAVWVGLGAVGVAAAGIVALGESASPARLACLALIVLGVIGLRLLDG